MFTVLQEADEDLKGTEEFSVAQETLKDTQVAAGR